MDRLQEITITRFPIPPSCNALFRPVNGRLIKSKEYRQYDHEVTVWILSQVQQLKDLRNFVKDLGTYVIHIDSMFFMPKNEIVCLNGKPKKNDTSNRIKALHDVVAETIMGIDDSYFWSGSFSKTVIPKGELGYVDLNFKLRNIE